MPKLDPVLDAWLFDAPGADTQAPAASEPESAAPETHLLSAAAPGGSGQVRVDAAVLTNASGALATLDLAQWSKYESDHNGKNDPRIADFQKIQQELGVTLATASPTLFQDKTWMAALTKAAEQERGVPHGPGATAAPRT